MYFIDKKEIFYYGKLGMNKKEIENWEQKIIDKIFSDDNLDYLGATASIRRPRCGSRLKANYAGTLPVHPSR